MTWGQKIGIVLARLDTQGPRSAAQRKNNSEKFARLLLVHAVFFSEARRHGRKRECLHGDLPDVCEWVQWPWTVAMRRMIMRTTA